MSQANSKSILQLFRNSFGGLSRSVWILAIIQLINRCGTMVLIFMAVYGKQELHFNIKEVGVVMAMFGIGSFTGVAISGKLVDRIGFYAIMFWSLFISGFLFLILGELKSFYSVCIGTFAVSAIGESFRPANMAAIGHYCNPDTETRSVSLSRLAINIGFAIGPALGGFLASINYKFLFWADGITCILAAFAVRLLLKEAPSGKKKIELNEQVLPSQSPYRDRIYLWFCLFNVFYALAFFQLFFTLPLFYKDVHRLSEQSIGWLMAINGLLVAGLEMILIYKIEGKWAKLKLIAFGNFILLFNYLLMPFANSYAFLVLGVLLITCSEMLAMPFMSSFMMQRSNAANRGQYSSLYSMTWSVAQISSPIIASLVIDNWGFNVWWYVLACLCTAVGAGFLLLNKKVNAAAT